MSLLNWGPVLRTNILDTTAVLDEHLATLAGLLVIQCDQLSEIFTKFIYCIYQKLCKVDWEDTIKAGGLQNFIFVADEDRRRN
jgi:hypothetical protein